MEDIDPRKAAELCSARLGAGLIPLETLSLTGLALF